MEQLVQLDEDANDEYVPERQLEQTVAEADEYEPVTQEPVTAVRPVVAQYEPAVHAEHEVDPVEA